MIARFTADLDALAGSGPVGLAVSGGPDSMALLLLAAAARPGGVTALTVDHGLRPEAADEVAMVAALCDRLGVPHHLRRLSLDDGGNIQARAREARYAALAALARDAGLMTLATAHHADDQAETLLMRLARGSGVAGLAGVRGSQVLAGMTVVRPLLAWRKAELEGVCDDARVVFARDPSNGDPRFDRAAIRAAMAGLDLDATMLARSAAHLADAADALDWATEAQADRLRIDSEEATIDAEDLPAELARRLLLRAFMLLGVAEPRGPDLERAMVALGEGRAASLSGLLLRPLGPALWRLAPEPPRRA